MRPYPARLRRNLQDAKAALYRAHISVIPRDANERRCPAYASDYYEIVVYRTEMGEPLDDLEEALASVPGVYATTRLPSNLGTDGNDPDWPLRYRSASTFRPQVRALYR